MGFLRGWQRLYLLPNSSGSSPLPSAGSWLFSTFGNWVPSTSREAQQGCSAAAGQGILLDSGREYCVCWSLSSTARSHLLLCPQVMVCPDPIASLGIKLLAWMVWASGRVAFIPKHKTELKYKIKSIRKLQVKYYLDIKIFLIQLENWSVYQLLTV